MAVRIGQGFGQTDRIPPASVATSLSGPASLLGARPRVRFLDAFGHDAERSRFPGRSVRRGSSAPVGTLLAYPQQLDSLGTDGLTECLARDSTVACTAARKAGHPGRTVCVCGAVVNGKRLARAYWCACRAMELGGAAGWGDAYAPRATAGTTCDAAVGTGRGGGRRSGRGRRGRGAARRSGRGRGGRDARRGRRRPGGGGGRRP